jgi:hypothetical protein
MKIILGDIQACYVITLEGWSAPLREIPPVSQFGGKAAASYSVTSTRSEKSGKGEGKNTPPFVIKDFY